jgi:DNA-binding transcriptional ArsR family regulator
VTVVPDALLDGAARMFSLLGDPARLRLVRELYENDELAVSELAERTGMTVANASQHLARLAEGGLVARRREGRNVLYRAADERLGRLCELVCESVRERAERLLA